MQSKEKVVIVVGPQMFREFLRTMLEAKGDLEVVDEVFDGMEAIECIKKHGPSLLLLDLALPRLSGVSVLNAVRDQFPDMKIMILTDYKADQYVLEAFQAGANGYCIKDASREELLLAIESVMAGHKFVSPGIAGNVVEGYLDGRKKIKESSDWDSITQREREVLKLLAEGYKNKEIGAMLHISCKTVEKHRSNIMNKLDLHNVAALTTFAIDHGLVNGNANSFIFSTNSPLTISSNGNSNSGNFHRRHTDFMPNMKNELTTSG